MSNNISKNTKKIKYIIPKNYDFKPKLFGIIEYRFGVFFLILSYFLLIFVKYIPSSLDFKIQFFLIITVPIFLLGTVGLQGENFFNLLNLLYSYYIKNKIYFYSKR